jgi:uncharacterized heparinase superfamily protein
LRTLRHLRPLQIGARLRLRLHHPRPDLRAAPAVRAVSGTYVPPVALPATLVGRQKFRLLGVERTCAVASDWQPRGVDKLWIYHLHYFDDLNASGSSERLSWHRELMERWLADNPPGRGDAWEPYPISRRLVNWVKWELGGRALPEGARASLAVQTRWLRRRLEYHLLGNHLFANAKALVYAGLYFEGPEAQHWYERGMAILARELSEQVLADGGQFERTPMYHAAALEDVLDLINVMRAYGRTPPPAWIERSARMRRWLAIMTHPDGEIAFFNDAAFGIAPSHAQLEDYAQRLGLAAQVAVREPLVVLEDSGYVRALAGPAYLLCDCAALGPDYQMGHAHADTLSFELSLAGSRLFVNSGTSVYGTSAERERQRGTAAHNTVAVDARDSSEVWAGFRVGRRARARLEEARAEAAQIRIRASHDGYQHLPGHNRHTREWHLSAAALSIMDTISGAHGGATAYFHLHPQVTATLAGSELLLRPAAGPTVQLRFEHADSVALGAGSWHPRFGAVCANQCVVVRFAAGRLATHVSWEGGA